MKCCNFRRWLSICLLLALLMTAVPAPARAAQPGQFVLAVVTQEQVVIEPVYVVYEGSDTVRTALKNSGHTFEGIDTGFIFAIDGVTDNFSLFYDANGYDLDTPAASVTTVCFTTAQDQYSPQYLALLQTMAAYNASTNGVKNYPAAQNAYSAALGGLYGVAGGEAEQLRAALQEAMDAYAAYLKGETVTLTLSVTQGSETNKAVNAVFAGAFGNTTEVKQATQVELIPGDYTFDISDGGINHVRGTLTLSAAQTLSVALPTGTWIANVDLSMDSGNAWAAVHREGNTYYVPDYASGNLYPYIEPGAGVDTTACGVYLADTENASRRTWQSKQTVLTRLVAPDSMEGTHFALEARLEDGAFEQYQRYDLQIVRIPTLASLTVVGDGTILPLAFDPAVTTYALTTVSDSLEVCADALCAEAAVTVNGGTDTTVAITGDSARITVEVSHINGQKTAYILEVTRVASVDVTLTHDASVAVSVCNAAGASIAPKAQNGTATVFALIPGEQYTYISTENTSYHTTAAFAAAEQLTIAVPTPDTTDWLNGLHVGPTKAVAFTADVVFSPENHSYTYQVGSNQTSFGLLPSLSEAGTGCTITGYYTDYRYWDSNYGARTLSLTDGNFRTTTTFLGASGEGNTLRLELSKTQNGVTWYQDYFLTAQRLLQLNSLAASTDGQGLILSQPDGTQKFDKDVLDYTVSLGQMQSSITLDLKLFSTASGNDNAVLLTVTCGANAQVLSYETLAVNEVQSVTLPLDTTQQTQTVTVTLERIGATAQIYTVTVQKLPPVEVAFELTPADAVLFLADSLTGTRVWPNEDGKYVLNLNGSYTYVATCYGYVAQTATFAAAEQSLLRIALEAAPQYVRTELAQTGDWLSFRGNAENNAVISAATPIAAGEAVLNWANKIGESMSGGGVGSPIIAGGVIYTYANDKVMKVDRETGEILLEREMDHASSFSITPPAYGEGMIFIGLSNGAVQAFDAETLESLWLYQDILSGQPNCPITYKDGYIYTGFWNSETKQANFVCISVTDEDPNQTQEAKTASWTYTAKGYYWAGAYVSENFLLVTTDDGDGGYTKGYGEILSLDPRTGACIDSQTALGVGDLRSTVCYDPSTDAYYFTSKGGDFYRIRVDAGGAFVEGSQKKLHLSNGTDNVSTPPMSTSTPVIYNGRAYVGVSGTSQFGAYSGHNITVIDLNAWSVAYSVPTQGYPQTSGLLTTAYEAGTEYVYVYFIDNYTPGKLCVIRDKAGQTAADPSYTTTETYTASGQTYSVQTAYVLFTPYGEQAQYAICSPIADAEGNLYFKNDSGYLMCVGSTITALTVEAAPEKTCYEVGQTFDAAGLKVVAQYANGLQKDVTGYITFSQEPLTANDTEFTLSYALGEYERMYQNRGDETGVLYYVPTATLDLKLYTDHLWDSGTVTKAPTASTAGERTYTCTLCGAVRTETINATGPCDGGATCPSARFTDVPAPSNWAHAGIDYAVSNKLFAGMSDTTFEPNRPMTRAMLVAVLWRYAGAPEEGSNTFTDVREGQWYTQAIAWAAENGIVAGVGNDRFDPNGMVTREQLAAILYRYAQKQGIDTGKGTDLSTFPDSGKCSGYARNAVSWAVAEGIISGVASGNTVYLQPQGNATRAQVAAILMRYIENITQ